MPSLLLNGFSSPGEAEVIFGLVWIVWRRGLTANVSLYRCTDLAFGVFNGLYFCIFLILLNRLLLLFWSCKLVISDSFCSICFGAMLEMIADGPPVLGLGSRLTKLAMCYLKFFFCDDLFGSFLVKKCLRFFFGVGFAKDDF